MASHSWEFTENQEQRNPGGLQCNWEVTLTFSYFSLKSLRTHVPHTLTSRALHSSETEGDRHTPKGNGLEMVRLDRGCDWRVISVTAV